MNARVNDAEIVRSRDFSAVTNLHATQPSVFVILFPFPVCLGVYRLLWVRVLPPLPPDASQSQVTFLHPFLLFDPPLYPPLSTTDLCLSTNVSNSLAEVGVLYFRQKTRASLLSSGWVWVLRAWPCTSEEMSGHSVSSVMRSKFFAPLRTDYIICESICEIQNYIFQTSKP